MAQPQVIVHSICISDLQRFARQRWRQLFYFPLRTGLPLNDIKRMICPTIFKKNFFISVRKFSTKLQIEGSICYRVRVQFIMPSKVSTRLSTKTLLSPDLKSLILSLLPPEYELSILISYYEGSGNTAGFFWYV